VEDATLVEVYRPAFYKQRFLWVLLQLSSAGRKLSDRQRHKMLVNQINDILGGAGRVCVLNAETNWIESQRRAAGASPFWVLAEADA
jgi:hypothetical protein